MTRHLEQIPLGTLVLVTTGCYSDYCVNAVTRATQNLDPEALLEEWLVAHPEQRLPYKFKRLDFLASLVSRGLLEELTSTEWHLDDYEAVHSYVAV